MMDMGCHGIAWFRWMLGGRPKAVSVQAHMMTVMHKGRTQGEDDSVVIVEFENGAIGVAENSWAKLGGMDDSVEVFGTGGVVYAICFAAMRRSLTVRRAMDTPWKKPATLRAGRSRFLKRPSTKGILRSCTTS